MQETILILKAPLNPQKENTTDHKLFSKPNIKRNNSSNAPKKYHQRNTLQGAKALDQVYLNLSFREILHFNLRAKSSLALLIQLKIYKKPSL